MFVNPSAGNYYLQSSSPCIDTGNPASPNDPDGTRCDMGAIYFDQSATHDVEVNLSPYGTPIQIPASGGSFEFNIEVANNETGPVSMTLWTMITLPSGSEYGPILNIPVAAPGNWSANRDRIQFVPASATAGNYTYDAYLGTYPSTVWDEDHFGFAKLASGDGGTYIDGWNNWGEDFYGWNQPLENTIPEAFSLFQAYPNPFNPSTNITFQLAKSGNVKLIVYDISGRVVSTLAEEWLEAGQHEFTFNGEHISSGVYFCSLKTDGANQTVKLILMK